MSIWPSSSHVASADDPIVKRLPEEDDELPNTQVKL